MVTKLNFFRLILNLTKIIPTLILITLVVYPTTSYAQISNSDIESIRHGTEWYAPNDDICSNTTQPGVSDTSTDSNSGDLTTHGGLDDLTFIANLDENKAAIAIDNYIQDSFPSSPFVGLGQDFVAGAKKSNINPFLAVAHLRVENGFATAPSGWHTVAGSHNAFGLSASSTQPHTYYNGRLIYQWPSWKDSLNTNLPGLEDWFAWLHRRISETSGSFAGKTKINYDYVAIYAPPTENDTNGYLSNMLGIINDVASLMNDPNLQPIQNSGSSGSNTNTSNSSAGCSTSTTTGTASEIASTALSLAWDYSVDNGKTSKNDAKPEYQQAKEEINPLGDWSDCGVFVATVMRKSGADLNYPLSDTTEGQKPYLQSNPDKYTILTNWSEENLQPGDIFIRNGHTFIYIGDPSIKAVEASLNQRVPGIRPSTNTPLPGGAYIVARLK